MYLNISYNLESALEKIGMRWKNKNINNNIIIWTDASRPRVVVDKRQ